TLIETLVMPTQEYDSLLVSEALRVTLIEADTRRVRHDHRNILWQVERIQTSSRWLHGNEHPRAASIGCFIHLAVAIVREVTRVARCKRDDTVGLSPLQDAVTAGSENHLGEECHEVDPQHGPEGTCKRRKPKGIL